MTKVKFFVDENGIYGFELKGHSSAGCDDFEGKIVCAAVSSAAYMAVNTISDIIGDSCDAQVDDAYMRLTVDNINSQSRIILEGFRIHLINLSEQYQNKIKISEV